MAEVNTAEKEAKAEAAFGVGFGDTPLAEATTVVAAEPKPELAKTDVVAEPPVKAEPKPEYIRVTKQDWDNSKASLGRIPALESQIAKLTGSVPQADKIIQQVIDKVKAQTPSGSTVELTDEDFAEFQETFPEVGATMRKSLDKILKRMNVQGTAVAPDPDAIDRAVEARLKARDEAVVAATREKEMSGLLETYPNWGEIVGRPAPGGEPVQTDWRKWATTNDQAGLESDSPAVVQASIAKFMESQKVVTAQPNRAAARRAVIADAVTPRAEGNPPPLNPPQSADDAFASGFKAVKMH